jgi:hypothetical protein
MTQFIIHPRTPEEARDEFLTDLRRRIDRVKNDPLLGDSPRDKLATKRVLYELESMLCFWEVVEIKVVEISRPVRRRKFPNRQIDKILEQHFDPDKEE